MKDLTSLSLKVTKNENTYHKIYFDGSENQNPNSGIRQQILIYHIKVVFQPYPGWEGLKILHEFDFSTLRLLVLKLH